MTEDEMVGWHHRLNGHEFEQALRDDEGQGSLVCFSPWGCEESDMTGIEQQISLQNFSQTLGGERTTLLVVTVVFMEI